MSILGCAGNGMSGERIVGGQCEYKHYKGTARITSIKAATAVGDAKQRYEVKFAFVPEGEIAESFAKTEGKEFLLTLKNSTLPGPGFLKKYGIETGRVFDCFLKVIVRGTCTPVLFEFPGIALDDYFE